MLRYFNVHQNCIPGIDEIGITNTKEKLSDLKKEECVHHLASKHLEDVHGL